MVNKEITLAKLSQGVLDPLRPGRIVGADFELEMGEAAEYLLARAIKFEEAFARFYATKKFVWQPFARMDPYQAMGLGSGIRYAFGIKITKPGTDFCAVYMAPYSAWLEKNLDFIARKAVKDYRERRLSHAQ